MTSSVAARTASNWAADARALPGMAQEHQRHRLARHVTALSPAGQLVMGHAGNVAAKAGALALRFTCAFHQWAATAPTPGEP